MTLFYHPDEYHAHAVCRELEKETFSRYVIVYPYSSPNRQSPDKHLQQKAIEQKCSSILTIHSDPKIDPYNYVIFVFSPKSRIYLSVFRRLQQKFEAGVYGFVKPKTTPTQIDLELNELNTTRQSLHIVEELLALLSNL
ncbi:MAG: hypothetical protein QXP82_03220 [Candidatus Aenigmatarchaeota archaeon]